MSDPKEARQRLFKFLSDNELYTKGYEEFEQQYSTPEAQAKLYAFLSSNELYTRSQEDFKSQYFTEKKNLLSGVAQAIFGKEQLEKDEKDYSPEELDALADEFGFRQLTDERVNRWVEQAADDITGGTGIGSGIDQLQAGILQSISQSRALETDYYLPPEAQLLGPAGFLAARKDKRPQQVQRLLESKGYFNTMTERAVREQISSNQKIRNALERSGLDPDETMASAFSKGVGPGLEYLRRVSAQQIPQIGGAIAAGVVSKNPAVVATLMGSSAAGGDMLQKIMQERELNDEDVIAAWSKGAIEGTAEAVLSPAVSLGAKATKQIAGRVVKGIFEEGGKAGARKVLQKMLMSGAGEGGEEVFVELAGALIDQLQEVDPDWNVSQFIDEYANSQDTAQLLETFVVGAITGAPIGGVQEATRKITPEEREKAAAEETRRRQEGPIPEERVNPRTKAVVDALFVGGQRLDDPAQALEDFINSQEDPKEQEALRLMEDELLAMVEYQNEQYGDSAETTEEGQEQEEQKEQEAPEVEGVDETIDLGTGTRTDGEDQGFESGISTMPIDRLKKLRGELLIAQQGRELTQMEQDILSQVEAEISRREDESYGDDAVSQQGDPEATLPENEEERQEAFEEPDLDEAIKGGQVGSMPVAEINMDPERFQYKADVDKKTGVSDKFKKDSFDPMKANVISVWTDPADGKTYVINGHHRLELAQRSGAENINVLRIDAPTAEQARFIGAVQNISEGQGTAVDAAKVFRDGVQEGESVDDVMKAAGLSHTNKIASDGVALSKLSDNLFTLVSTGKLKTNIGVIIGDNIQDPDVQEEFYNAIKGKGYTNQQIRIMAEDVANAKTQTVTETDLFGTTEKQTADFARRANFIARIEAKISKVKNLLGKVASNDDLLAEFGNDIDKETSAGASKEAAQALAIFKKYRNIFPEINEIINRGFDRIKAGESQSTVIDETTKELTERIPEIFSRETSRASQTQQDTGRPVQEPPAEPAVETGQDLDEEVSQYGDPEAGIPDDLETEQRPKNKRRQFKIAATSHRFNDDNFSEIYELANKLDPDGKTDIREVPRLATAFRQFFPKGVEVFVHETMKDAKEFLRNNYPDIDAGGLDGANAFYFDDTVHFIASSPSPNPLKHEFIHSLIGTIAVNDLSLFITLYESLESMPEFAAWRDKRYIRAAYEGYGGPLMMMEELMVEFLAQVGGGTIELSPPSKSKFVRLIHELLIMLGLSPSASAGDFRELARNLAVAMRNGIEIKNQYKESRWDGLSDVKKSISVWHGSRYSFGRFDPTMIGEGELWEGYGFYFSSKENVARFYADEGEYDMVVNGKPVMPGSTLDEVRYIFEDNSTAEEMLAQFEEDVESLQRSYPSLTDKQVAFIREVLSNNPTVQFGGGYMYKTVLHEGKTPDEYHYLNLNNPLDKEAANKILAHAKEELSKSDYNSLKKAIDKGSLSYTLDEQGPWPSEKGVYEPSGAVMFAELTGIFMGDKEDATNFLLAAGIDGMEYQDYDFDSSATNYVVFDPDAITIKEKIKLHKVYDPKVRIERKKEEVQERISRRKQTVIERIEARKTATRERLNLPTNTALSQVGQVGSPGLDRSTKQPPVESKSVAQEFSDMKQEGSNVMVSGKQKRMFVSAMQAELAMRGLPLVKWNELAKYTSPERIAQDLINLPLNNDTLSVFFVLARAYDASVDISNNPMFNKVRNREKHTRQYVHQPFHTVVKALRGQDKGDVKKQASRLTLPKEISNPIKRYARSGDKRDAYKVLRAANAYLAATHPKARKEEFTTITDAVDKAIDVLEGKGKVKDMRKAIEAIDVGRIDKARFKAKLKRYKSGKFSDAQEKEQILHFIEEVNEFLESPIRSEATDVAVQAKLLAPRIRYGLPPQRVRSIAFVKRKDNQLSDPQIARVLMAVEGITFDEAKAIIEDSLKRKYIPDAGVYARTMARTYNRVIQPFVNAANWITRPVVEKVFGKDVMLSDMLLDIDRRIADKYAGIRKLEQDVQKAIGALLPDNYRASELLDQATSRAQRHREKIIKRFLGGDAKNTLAARKGSYLYDMLKEGISWLDISRMAFFNHAGEFLRRKQDMVNQFRQRKMDAIVDLQQELYPVQQKIADPDTTPKELRSLKAEENRILKEIGKEVYWLNHPDYQEIHDLGKDTVDGAPLMTLDYIEQTRQKMIADNPRVNYWAEKVRTELLAEYYDTLEEYQLVSDEQLEALRNGTSARSNVGWTHYVPMAVDDNLMISDDMTQLNKIAATGSFGIQALNTGGREQAGFMDRNDTLTQLMTNLFAAREFGEHNKGRRALAKLVSRYNSNWFGVRHTTTKTTTNDLGEITTKEVLTKGPDADGRQILKTGIPYINENGRTSYIYPKTALAQRSALYQGFQQGGTFADPLFKIANFALRRYMTFLRNGVTSFNIVFGVSQVMADLQDTLTGGMVGADPNWKSKQNAKFRRKFLSNMRKVGAFYAVDGVKSIATGDFKRLEQGQSSTDPSQMTVRDFWIEAQEHGMPMSWVRHNFSSQAGYDALAKDISAIQKDINAGKKSPRRIGRALTTGVWQTMGNMNDALENFNRLNVYMTARQMGLSPQKAAQLGKDSAVNFERKGTHDNWFKLLYMFWGAAINGVKRSGRVMKAMGPKGAAAIIGGAMLNRLLLYYTADEDELNDIIQNEYVNRNRVVIKIPFTEHHLDFKAPYSFLRIYYAIGNGIVDMAMDKKTFSDAYWDLADATFTAFSPISGNASWTGWAPTVAQTPIQVTINKDYKNAPIVSEFTALTAKRDADKYRPSTEEYEGTDEVLVQFFDRLYNTTGGKIDKSPAYMQYLAEQMFMPPAYQNILGTIDDVPTWVGGRRLRNIIADELGYDTEDRDKSWEDNPTIRALYRPKPHERMVLFNFFQLSDRKPAQGLTDEQFRYILDAYKLMKKEGLVDDRAIDGRIGVLRERFPDKKWGKADQIKHQYSK